MKRSLWTRARGHIDDALSRLARKVLGSPEARLQAVLQRLGVLMKRIGGNPKALEQWKTLVERLCVAPDASPAVVLALVSGHLPGLMSLFSGDDARFIRLIEAAAWRECASHLLTVLSDEGQRLVPEDQRRVYVELLKIFHDSRYRIALERQMFEALRRSMGLHANPSLDRVVHQIMDDRQMLDPGASSPDGPSLTDLVGFASLHGMAVAAALATSQDDRRSLVVAGVARYGYRFSEYLRLSNRYAPGLYGPPTTELAGVVTVWANDANATSRADEAEARARYFLDVLTLEPRLARVAAKQVLRLPPGHALRDVARIRDAFNAQIHTAVDQIGAADPHGPGLPMCLSTALGAMAGLVEHQLVSRARLVSVIDAGRSLLANPALPDLGASFRLAATAYFHAEAQRAREKGESSLAARYTAGVVELCTPLLDAETDPLRRQVLSVLRDSAAGEIVKADETLREMADIASGEPGSKAAQVVAARMDASRAYRLGQYDRVIERLLPVVPALEEQYLSSVLDADVASAGKALAESAIHLAFAHAHQENWEAAITALDRTKSLRFRYQSALRAGTIGNALRELEADIHARTRGIPPPIASRRQTPSGLTDLLETYRQMREKAKVPIVSPGLADIAARLADDEAVVVLGVGPSELLLSIVRADAGAPRVQSELLGSDDRAAVLDAIGNVNSGWLVARGFKGQFVEPRSSLQHLLGVIDRIIGRPLARMLDGTPVRRLTVIPHDVLHLIPFWALPALASFHVMVSPSAAQFVAGRREDRRLEPSALVVGNPTSDLTLAAVEARVVRQHLQRSGCLVDFLEREQATETALVHGVADRSIFHFSGHGRSDLASPAASALEVHADVPVQEPGVDPLVGLASVADWQPTYELAGDEWIENPQQRWADVAKEGRLVRRLYPAARRIELRLEHRSTGTLLARYEWKTDEEDDSAIYGERTRLSELWTAGDILTDRCFSRCGLVVLSSCEAGAGGISFGVDEFAGLPAALQLAGVAAVISPLWPVRVEVALLFADLFYGELTGTRGTADLLMLVRQTQRRLRRMRRDEAASALSALLVAAEGRAARLTLEAVSRGIAQGADERPFAHPYDWAAFHLIGTPVLTVPFVGERMESAVTTSDEEEDERLAAQDAELADPVQPQPAVANTASAGRDDVFELARAAEILLAASDDDVIRSLAAESLYDRGQAYLRADDAQRALADFTRVVELAPGFTAAHIRLAELHAASGNDPEALNQYGLALAQQDDAAAHIGRALLHGRHERSQEALEDLDRAIALSADADTTFVAYQTRGVIQYAARRPQEAVEDFTKALAHRPEDASSYNSRGLAWLEADDARQAAADFTRASALAPTMIEAHHNHGLACGALKEYAQAIAHFDVALALAPGSLQTCTDRGLNYAYLGDFDRALADHNRVLAEDPDHVAGRYNRACALSLKHDMGSILEDVTAAIGRDLSLVNHARSDSDLEWARSVSPELRALLGVDDGASDQERT